MEKVPERFGAFVREKQAELLKNVATSAVFGAVVANLVAVLAGEASGEVAEATVRAILPVFALVGVASAFTLLVKKD